MRGAFAIAAVTRGYPASTGFFARSQPAMPSGMT